MNSRFIFLLACVLCACSLSYAQPTAWVSKGVGGGGAVYRPSISPHNGNNLFLACDMSPIHQSANFGQTWSVFPYLQLPGNRSTEMQFTSNPAKLYALKKPANFYLPSKSYDGGLTWVNASNPCITTANQYYASPLDTDLVIISDVNKIYFSNNENSATFSTLLTYPLTSSGHLAGVFFENKDTIYVCSHDTLIYTFNGGSTWNSAFAGTQGIPSNEHIVSFKGAKQGNKWVFYAVTIIANPNYKIFKTFSEDYTLYKGVYKLSQNQSQWVSIGANLPAITDKVYLIGLADKDTSTVYLAGSSNSLGVSLGAVFRSINSGSSFTNIFLTSGMFNSNANITTGWLGKHSLTTAKFRWNGLNYISGLAVDPNNAARVVCCDGMTIHTSLDLGSNWKQAYTDTIYQNLPSTMLQQSQSYKTSGLETTAAYWLSWIGPLNLFASYNDILARKSNDGGATWNFNITGLDSIRINDVNMTLVHPLTKKMYAACGEVPGSNGDYTDARAGLVPGRITVSSDSGATWQTLKSFGHSVSSISFDPNSTIGMYATVVDILGGIGGVYKCSNILASPSIWVKLASPARSEGRALQITALKNGDLIVVYGSRDTSRSSSPSFVYSASSGAFYSKDGGISWADSNLVAMNKSVANIEVDRNDTSENTWLAFVGSNGSTGGVYRTINKGFSWTPVYFQATMSGTFHPTLSNTLYICTENNGLLYASNTQTNSFSISTINSFPFKRPQKVFFNTYNTNEVWVTTFGNGIRMGLSNSLPVSFLSLSGACNAENIHLNWRTASEFNNAHFTIERSTDLLHWESVGMVLGKKQSVVIQKYEFTDSVNWNKVQSNDLYYRIKQTDLNGDFAFSPTIGLDPCAMQMAPISLFPNPANDLIQFSKPMFDVEVYSIQGQLMNQLLPEANELSTHSYPDGLYVLKSRNGFLKFLVHH
ncbi:MAG: hypothetical protein SGJ00_12705 [bacterium]|nr:hypothetical protein [bacterium]